MNPECGSRERALLRRGLAAPSELVRQHTSYFSFHCLDRRCQDGRPSGVRERPGRRESASCLPFPICVRPSWSLTRFLSSCLWWIAPSFNN